TALIEHLLSHSPLFKLTFLYPWYFIMLGFFSLLARWAGFLSPRIKTREKRQVLAFAVYAFAVILFLLIDRLLGMKLRFDLVLLSWSWPITALLLVGSIAFFYLNLWLVSDKEMLLAGSKSFFCKENNRPVGRAQTVQYIKTFTLLVAIFDFVVLLAQLL
ncbi:MAG TPA: hypothetical protein VFB12_11965, partial [Ktedonobacteraceae bacterium]|nr:hypothetical protein [Ktedonobacteraceae bacterium]